jgi:hypothetical protein
MTEAEGAAARLAKFRETLPADWMDEATGLTGEDLDAVVRLAAMSPRQRTAADTPGKPAKRGESLHRAYANAILNAMSETSEAFHGDPGIEMASAIDGISFAFATILSSHPDAGTPRGLRMLIEAFSQRLKQQVQIYRKHLDDGGDEAVIARPTGRT